MGLIDSIHSTRLDSLIHVSLIDSCQIPEERSSPEFVILSRALSKGTVIAAMMSIKDFLARTLARHWVCRVGHLKPVQVTVVLLCLVLHIVQYCTSRFSIQEIFLARRT
jgi:hypothetical protein